MKQLLLRSFILLFTATIIFFPVESSAQTDTKVRLSIKNASLTQVIKEIEKQTGLNFFYSGDDLKVAKTVSISANNEPLNSVLNQLSAQTGLAFNLIDKTIYVRRKDATPEPTSDGGSSLKVIGRIIAVNDGSPLAGANIILKNSDRGVIADNNGNFSIEVPSTKSSLIVTYSGFTPKEITVGNQNNILVALAEAEKKLEEVVVVGYGSQLKKNYAGSSVKIGAKDIRNLPVISADYALQGNASGVQVTANSSTPGGGIKILVRGMRSVNASNEPLFIVDGVPVLSGNLVGESLGGETQNLLAGINPSDIESMTILKDASSTAIYGARGANGVVVITTKKGLKSGKAQIDFNYSTGSGKFIKQWDMLGQADYRKLIEESRVNSGLSPLTLEGNQNTKWQDVLFRNQRYHDAQLSLRGGNQQTQFFVSGSYRTEEGPVLGMDYKRGTFRANLNHEVSKKFLIGTTLTFSRELNQRTADNNGSGSPFQAGVLTSPTLPVYNADGSLYQFSALYGSVNPMIDATQVRYDNTTTKIIGNLNLTYKILPDVTFRTDISGDYNALREDHFYPTGSTRALSIPATFGNGGYYSNIEATTYAVEPVLSYDKKFNDKHQFNALVGSTFQSRTTFRGFVRGEGLGSSNQLTYLNAAANPRVTQSSRLDYSFTSIFGRLGYTFNDKYLVNATVRRDGSSRFGADKRFGTFVASSAAWNFSEEAFFQKLKWLSFGKLRVGYGITGNDQFGDFAYLGTWSGAGYLGQSGLFPNQLGNPNLKWEQTGTFDAGIEIGLDKDRFTLSAGYYNSLTRDLLFFLPVSGMTGFNEVATNLGKIRNSGWEFQAMASVINSKNFTWRINGNITFQKNNVEQLPVPPLVYPISPSTLEQGLPIGAFKTYVYNGVNVANGDALFKDLNKDSSLTTTDQQFIGKGNPDYFGGITNSFRYKNLTLDIFVNFMQDFELFNLGQWFMENRFSGVANFPSYAMNRWQKPGDVTDVPRLYYFSTNNTRISSRYVSDGSFVRLKNITLGYELPASAIKAMKIRSLRVFATATNLFTITDYKGLDPEVSSFNISGPPNQRTAVNNNLWIGNDFFAPPQLKQFIFGVNIGL